ncbi:MULTISPECIES: glycosyltransferase [unclassified Pseudoalteromonas]|uniref:glycosyltransferase n=1 Tax=unclassified Pseudoalteromonas TaxID=194690 RepID=UPI002E0F74D7
MISSAVGAIPCIIKHGITGFLIQETNTQHFEQQVEKLLSQSEDHTNTIINNAYRTLEERFSGKQQFKLLRQANTGT